MKRPYPRRVHRPGESHLGDHSCCANLSTWGTVRVTCETWQAWIPRQYRPWDRRTLCSLAQQVYLISSWSGPGARRSVLPVGLGPAGFSGWESSSPGDGVSRIFRLWRGLCMICSGNILTLPRFLSRLFSSRACTFDRSCRLGILSPLSWIQFLL